MTILNIRHRFGGMANDNNNRMPSGRGRIVVVNEIVTGAIVEGYAISRGDDNYIEQAYHS